MSMKAPIKYPVKHYSDLDVDAPQLNDVDGAIKNILKACLIDGYGDKEGAGWKLLFDDDFSIMFSPPHVDSNIPCVRINNGMCNGVISHTISSFTEPTSLYGDTPLFSSNALFRDKNTHKKWDLVVCDFGFILCYRMAENNYNNENKNNILYVGGLMNMKDSDNTMYVANTISNVAVNGTGSPWMGSFLNANSYIVNLLSGVSSGVGASYVSISKAEKYYNDEYMAQRVFINHDTILPFYKSVCTTYNTVGNSYIVEIGGRSMLRYINRLYQPYGDAIYYIPLDYWEL